MAQKSQKTELFYLSAPAVMTKVANLTAVTGTGGAVSQIDITNLDSTEMEYLAGLGNPGAVSAPIDFTPANTGHQALLALFQSGATVPWVIGLSDGTAPPTAAGSTITYPATRTYVTFQGYIADFPIDAAVNSKLTTAMTIQRSGAKTVNFKV